MRFIQRVLQAIGRSGSQQAQTPPETGPIDEALDAARHRYRAVDPGTGVQWGRLNAAMEDMNGAEPAADSWMGKRIAWPALAITTAVTAFIIIRLIWFQQAASTTYATARGQHSAITLSDSTEVILNHTSELVVHHWSRATGRTVALDGEAFFHVRRTGTPFIVSTPVAAVEVLGTEFNVRYRDSTIEVGVLAGKVNVSVTMNQRDSSVVLLPGQLVSIGIHEFPGNPASILAADFPGWIHGKFTFQRTNLLAVCREFESQFDIVITIGDPRLRNETITGTIDGRNADAALATLASLSGHKYRHEKNGYTLY